MDNQFKLSEKTIVVHGPVSPTVQSLANHLTELGADVALATDDEKRAQVYCANLSDLREVHRHRGRAAGLYSPRSTLKGCNEVFAKASEAFGSVDVFIDANFSSLFIDEKKPESAEAIIKQQIKLFEETLLMTATAEQYLSSRTRGRIIFLTAEAAQRGLTKNAANCMARNSLKDYAKNISLDYSDKQLTANVVVCGVTEDYLQHRFKGKPVSEAKKEFATIAPDVRLTEPMEIANVVGFLASALSSAVTGQTIYATHGL
jgi:glucose 1-dehydrogenase